MYFVIREAPNMAGYRPISPTVEYDGLAWFPTEADGNKITSYEEIEDARAVAASSAMEWEGISFQIFEAIEVDSDGPIKTLDDYNKLVLKTKMIEAFHRPITQNPTSVKMAGQDEKEESDGRKKSNSRGGGNGQSTSRKRKDSIRDPKGSGRVNHRTGGSERKANGSSKKDSARGSKSN